MATLMKCTVAHFQGNDFIAEGTVLPVGHHQIIDAFFTPFEVSDPKPAKKSSKATPSEG